MSSAALLALEGAAHLALSLVWSFLSTVAYVAYALGVIALLLPVLLVTAPLRALFGTAARAESVAPAPTFALPDTAGYV